jgi:CubicO group peptidase (beta-lactamase class C family)
MTRTLEILEAERAKGSLVGAHLYISRAGESVFEHGPDLIMSWLSSGKPITAVLIGQLVEMQRLEWTTRIHEILPEFIGPGKDAVTIAHLLTHTAGLRTAERVPDEFPWAHKIAAICQCPLEQDWIPGQKAGYHISGTWYLLAEIIQRVAGKPFEEVARINVFGPVGMANSRFTFADSSKLSVMMDTTKHPPEPARELLDAAMLRPGGGARGPVRELGRFYESLLGFGPPILKASTIGEMTSRKREGMYDWTFLHKMDWGLGFIINSNRYGAETVPYGFGRHASENTFGHGGSQSSCAFADPEHGLVVAWVLNGRPGERAHQPRARELNSAIYEDLGL